MPASFKELQPDGDVVNVAAAAAASPSMAPKGLSNAQSAARPSDSLAMMAFKGMMQNPSQPEVATPLQCIDPLDLRFFQEVGDSEFIAVEKGSWHPQPASGLAADLIVCVKSLKPGVLTTPQELRMVVDEARKMAALRHESLAQLLGLGCYSDASMQDVRSTVFFVERWAGSTTLYAAIRKCQQNGMSVYNPLYTTHDGLRWCLQIARALAYLHSNGITHGDVKLENIMLTDVPAGELSMADAVLVDLKPHRHVALQSRFSPVGEAPTLATDDAVSVASAGTGALGDEDGSARASSTLHRRSRPVTLQRFSSTRQASAVSDAEARVRTASLDVPVAAAGQWAGKQTGVAGVTASGLRLEAVHRAMALRDASLVKGGEGQDSSSSSLRLGRAQADGSNSGPGPGTGSKAQAPSAVDASVASSATATAGLSAAPGAAGVQAPLTGGSLASTAAEAVAYISGYGHGPEPVDLPALLLDTMPPRRYRPALHLSFDGREGFLGQALFSMLDSSDAFTSALPSTSASRDTSKARWLGGGRHRRRQSWDEHDAKTAGAVAAAAAAAVGLACASLLGGGEGPGAASHAAQAWRSQVVLDPGDFHQAAAVDVATACASGPGALGEMLRSLHADVEALDIPSTCQATASGGGSPEGAKLAEREADVGKEQGAADEAVIKLLATARRSGNGILKRQKSEKAFQRQQSGMQGQGVLAVVPPAEEEVGGWYAGTLTPVMSVKQHTSKSKKKVRFTLPTAEEGQATGRDYSLIYRAPELSSAPSAKNRTPHEPTPASDVFSFAVVCYEILSRAAVAPGELTRQGLMDYHHRVINGYREPLKEGWPQQIKDLLSQAWSARPGDRPSASEMVHRLAPLLDSNQVLTALTFPDGLMPKDQGCCCIS